MKSDFEIFNNLQNIHTKIFGYSEEKQYFCARLVRKGFEKAAATVAAHLPENF